ncbi:MAG: MaoC family dehydratase [Dongiaceae bacterium]
MTPLSAALPVGLRAVFVRRVTPEMVQAFADLVGDHDPIHLDAAFCRATPYGRPIAHGALLIGFMSAASTAATRDSGLPLVSLGYDRIRLVAPVFPGEETTTVFAVTGHDEARGRILAELTVHAGGRLAAVATNILKLVA